MDNDSIWQAGKSIPWNDAYKRPKYSFGQFDEEIITFIFQRAQKPCSTG